MFFMRVCQKCKGAMTLRFFREQRHGGFHLNAKTQRRKGFNNSLCLCASVFRKNPLKNLRVPAPLRLKPSVLP